MSFFNFKIFLGISLLSFFAEAQAEVAKGLEPQKYSGPKSASPLLHREGADHF
jgi:hypothetical protein